MANPDDKKADLDQSKLPGEEAAQAESDLFEGISDLEDLDLSGLMGFESTAEAPAELADEPIAAEQLSAVPETAEKQKELAEEPVAKASKTPRKLPVQYLEWGGAIGVSVILLAVALFGFLYFSTAVYGISVVLVSCAIWKSRATNTVYTVILGCTLVAILTAIYCLWSELGRYEFDVKARRAKQRVSLSQPHRIIDLQKIV